MDCGKNGIVSGNLRLQVDFTVQVFGRPPTSGKIPVSSHVQDASPPSSFVCFKARFLRMKRKINEREGQEGRLSCRMAV
jgi:hypothetical protein